MQAKVLFHPKKKKLKRSGRGRRSSGDGGTREKLKGELASPDGRVKRQVVRRKTVSELRNAGREYRKSLYEGSTVAGGKVLQGRPEKKLTQKVWGWQLRGGQLRLVKKEDKKNLIRNPNQIRTQKED